MEGLQPVYRTNGTAGGEAPTLLTASRIGGVLPAVSIAYAMPIGNIIRLPFQQGRFFAAKTMPYALAECRPNPAASDDPTVPPRRRGEDPGGGMGVTQSRFSCSYLPLACRSGPAGS